MPSERLSISNSAMAAVIDVKRLRRRRAEPQPRFTHTRTGWRRAPATRAAVVGPLPDHPFPELTDQALALRGRNVSAKSRPRVG